MANGINWDPGKFAACIHASDKQARGSTTPAAAAAAVATATASTFLQCR